MQLYVLYQNVTTPEFFRLFATTSCAPFTDVLLTHSMLLIKIFPDNYSSLPGAIVGIGSTGSFVSLGHNTIDSPSRMKVGGAGVLGAEGAEYDPFSTSNRSS